MHSQHAPSGRHAHGHSHGLVDRSIMRSRAGVKAVAITLAILAVTALVQAAIYVATVIGNAIAARIRLRAGRRLDSPALVADGQHARSDAIVSAGVVATASVVALGVPIADPIMGLVITALILRITWESWRTVRGAHRH